MSKDLTTSLVARKNVLNNPYALQQLEANLELGGLSFEGETVFTRAQAAEILDIDIRTVERYLASHGDELHQSGYQNLKGKNLKNIKLRYVSDIDVGDIRCYPSRYPPRCSLVQRLIFGVDLRTFEHLLRVFRGLLRTFERLLRTFTQAIVNTMATNSFLEKHP